MPKKSVKIDFLGIFFCFDNLKERTVYIRLKVRQSSKLYEKSYNSAERAPIGRVVRKNVQTEVKIGGIRRVV